MGEANERTNEREKEERTKDRIEVEEEGLAFAKKMWIAVMVNSQHVLFCSFVLFPKYLHDNKLFVQDIECVIHSNLHRGCICHTAYSTSTTQGNPF